MLDMHSDATMLTAHFGLHIVQCEAHEIVTLYEKVTKDEIEATEQRILNFFDTPDPVSDPISEKLKTADLEVAARVSIALEKFKETKNLDGLAYYYEGEANSTDTIGHVQPYRWQFPAHTAAGFPMCGESDLKTCIAMLIMDRLGIGGSFAEFHPVDFKEGFVLVGHDGPHKHRHCRRDGPCCAASKNIMASRVSVPAWNLRSKKDRLPCSALVLRMKGNSNL